MTPSENAREVPASKSILSIQGTTHYAAPILALGGENYEIKGDVSLDLKPNQHYYIKGSLSNAYSAVWVEDNKGKIISDKIQSGTAPTQNTPSTDKPTGTKATVYFFNTAGFMHKLDGTDSLSITLDDKPIGSLSAGEYMKVETTSGNHQVKLTHRDMIPFSSSHDMSAQAPATYLQVSPTIMSNSLSVSGSLPANMKETAYKQ